LGWLVGFHCHCRKAYKQRTIRAPTKQQRSTQPPMDIRITHTDKDGFSRNVAPSELFLHPALLTHITLLLAAVLLSYHFKCGPDPELAREILKFTPLIILAICVALNYVIDLAEPYIAICVAVLLFDHTASLLLQCFGGSHGNPRETLSVPAADIEPKPSDQAGGRTLENAPHQSLPRHWQAAARRRPLHPRESCREKAATLQSSNPTTPR